MIQLMRTSSSAKLHNCRLWILLASVHTLWMAPHQLQLSLSSFWAQKRRVEHFTISSLLCAMIWRNKSIRHLRSRFVIWGGTTSCTEFLRAKNAQADVKIGVLPSSTTPQKTLMFFVQPLHLPPKPITIHTYHIRRHSNPACHTSTNVILLQSSASSWTESTPNTWNRKQLPQQNGQSHVRLPWPSTA